MRECLTHRKEAAVPILWSGTIKGRVERGLGGEENKRSTEERRLGKSSLTNIRCSEEQHLTLQRKMKVHISHIRTKVKSVKVSRGSSDTLERGGFISAKE